MRDYYTAYCKDCKRMIQFVFTENGRKMPVSCESAYILPDRDGKKYYVMDYKPIFGRLCDPDEAGAVRVQEPHFYNCPSKLPKRVQTCAAASAASAATLKEKQEARRAELEKEKAEKAKAEREAREWEHRQASIFDK